MADKVMPGPVPDGCSIREAVSIHTTKIIDGCRDKDCIEDLRLYLTPSSQAAIESAVSVRARSATLLSCLIDVEEVTFNRGYYTIDVRYFYKIQGEAQTLMGSPVDITGLAVFDKRVILFGSEGGSKVFTSDASGACSHRSTALPTGVVDAVDPIVLSMKIADMCGECCDNSLFEIPACIYDEFADGLSFDMSDRRVLVTLGQFSIIRLERDVQLIMPSYDYFMPDKECVGGSEDDPCALFSRIHFPVDEFYPPDTLDAPEGYREARTSLGG